MPWILAGPVSVTGSGSQELCSSSKRIAAILLICQHCQLPQLCMYKHRAVACQADGSEEGICQTP